MRSAVLSRGWQERGDLPRVMASGGIRRYEVSQ